MDDKIVMSKQERLDKMRCAQFLLQMIIKYGAQIQEKHNKQGCKNN